MPILEQRLTGVCAATLTPLNAAHEPDHAEIITHCRRLLANGCDAINLLGTTGEATSLPVAARLSVMEAIAASGLPLGRFMVGTGAAAFADALTLTRAAVEFGFAGALVIPPFYFKNITDEGMFAFYDALIERVGDRRLRLYLYHFPQLSGFAFSPALVARIAAAFPQTLAGIKDSSGAAGYAESIVAACPSIDVFPSSESALADAESKGFAGCISATLNVSAPLAGDVWRGGHGSAAALGEIRALLTRHQLVPALRTVMAALRADDGWLRQLPPLAPLAPPDARELLESLDAIPAFGAVRRTFAA